MGVNEKQTFLFLLCSYLFVRCDVFWHAFDRFVFWLQCMRIDVMSLIPGFFHDLAAFISDGIEIALVIAIIWYGFCWLYRTCRICHN